MHAALRGSSLAEVMLPAKRPFMKIPTSVDAKLQIYAFLHSVSLDLQF